jgi:hypothetical protein
MQEVYVMFCTAWMNGEMKDKLHRASSVLASNG